MAGVPCPTCAENCGGACAEFARARERERLAVLACGGAGLITRAAPYYLASVEEDCW